MKYINHPAFRLFFLPLIHFFERILSPFISEETFSQRVSQFFENESSKIGVENHLHHNGNPYLRLMGFGPLIIDVDKFRNKHALDFGCGGGRNMLNIDFYSQGVFARIDGCDIAEGNIQNAKNYFSKHSTTQSQVFKTDGISVRSSNSYSFIFSTIVLQHIPSYSVRKKILKDLWNLLEIDGLMIFQMGFSLPKMHKKNSVRYHVNNTAAIETNGRRDVRVTDPNQVVQDLNEIGARNISWFITPAFADSHPYWIWFHVQK